MTARELRSLQYELKQITEERDGLKEEVLNLEEQLERDRDDYEDAVQELEEKAAKEKQSKRNLRCMIKRVQYEGHNTDYTDVEQFVLDFLPWDFTKCKRCHAILDPFKPELECRNCRKIFE